MDIIEQAAKRLEELRRSGADVPPESSPPNGADKPLERPRQTTAPSADTAPASVQQVSRLIELNMSTLAAHGIITPDAVRSQLADEMRVIKRPLLNNAEGKGAAPIRDANLIMITSAVPQEGKTTIAANLAMSIAMELDHTVLLVDADVARPNLPNVFGFGHKKGLLDLLLDPSLDPSEVLLRTNIEKLSILPSGTQHPRATELLASDAMNQRLADLASRYSDRIIIFDSPPLLVTTESRALAAHMGQVVVVVRAESTRHSEVRHALATIEACPVKMVVLNQATGSLDGHGYGYGYGYGYRGYGYGHEQGGAKPSKRGEARA